MMEVGGDGLLVDDFFRFGEGDAGDVEMTFVLDVLVDHGENGEEDDDENDIVEIILDEGDVAE